MFIKLTVNHHVILTMEDVLIMKCAPYYKGTAQMIHVHLWCNVQVSYNCSITSGNEVVIMTAVVMLIYK